MSNEYYGTLGHIAINNNNVSTIIVETFHRQVPKPKTVKQQYTTRIRPKNYGLPE